jgi:hypothetical protein
MTALSIIGGGDTSKAQAAGPPDGFYGAMFFKAKAAADIEIAGQVTFPKPKEAPPQHSTTQFEPRGLTRTTPTIMAVTLHQSGEVESRPDSDQQGGNSPPSATAGGQQPKNNGTGVAQKNQTPATANPLLDCQPKASGGQQPACKFSATIDDENLYHWDVSFAVPFHTLTEVQYTQPSGTGASLVPKTVTRLNAYVLAEIFPIAADIKTPPLVALPHFVLGLPISGKVFNKPIIGAGDGVNLTRISFLKWIPIQIQFFGGVVYNKEFRQIPGTTGASNVQGHRVWNGVYGVEIPVRQFQGLLKPKKSTSSTPTGTTNGTNGGAS